MMTVTAPRCVLVVGAGCFGLSTAYHLLQRGFANVTVIDRSDTLPAPDAASHDINKIVRTSYVDAFYTRLAHEAIQAWKDGDVWGDAYHQSGVLVLDSADATYAEQAYDNDANIAHARLQKLDSGAGIAGVFPPQIKLGSACSTRHGYLNRDGGWANATQGISLLMSNVTALGGVILSGKRVESLLRSAGDAGAAGTHTGRTSGVRCTDGTVYHADLVILSTGSWTSSAFPELRLQEQCLATGQSIAMVQLTEEEAALYKACPVVLDFSSGFYVFPPNDRNLVKLAVHAAGYTHTAPTGSTTTSAVSTPRTVSSHAEDGLRIPKAAVRALRNGLREVYPDLAEKPFCGTRLCWYADSPDADWVIGFHPSDPSLMLATGGSGHAYKFLPVIGRLVVDIIQGVLDPAFVKKFAVGRKHEQLDSSRPRIKPEELDVMQLCSPEDILIT